MQISERQGSVSDPGNVTLQVVAAKHEQEMANQPSTRPKSPEAAVKTVVHREHKEDKGILSAVVRALKAWSNTLNPQVEFKKEPPPEDAAVEAHVPVAFRGRSKSMDPNASTIGALPHFNKTASGFAKRSMPNYNNSPSGRLSMSGRIVLTKNGAASGRLAAAGKQPGGKGILLFRPLNGSANSSQHHLSTSPSGNDWQGVHASEPLPKMPHNTAAHH